jgi:hypothetical protein
MKLKDMLPKFGFLSFSINSYLLFGIGGTDSCNIYEHMLTARFYVSFRIAQTKINSFIRIYIQWIYFIPVLSQETSCSTQSSGNGHRNAHDCQNLSKIGSCCSAWNDRGTELKLGPKIWLTTFLVFFSGMMLVVMSSFPHVFPTCNFIEISKIPGHVVTFQQYHASSTEKVCIWQSEDTNINFNLNTIRSGKDVSLQMLPSVRWDDRNNRVRLLIVYCC